MSLKYWIYCFILVGVLSVFTWRHGGQIGVPKQWNGGHVGVPSVPNQSSGSWTFFLCKNFLLLQLICIVAGHVSENVDLSKKNNQNNKGWRLKFGKLKLTVKASTCLRNDALKKISHRLRAIQEKSCTRKVALNLSATWYNGP